MILKKQFASLIKTKTVVILKLQSISLIILVLFLKMQARKTVSINSKKKSHNDSIRSEIKSE